jgi:hypothetical protein
MTYFRKLWRLVLPAEFLHRTAKIKQRVGPQARALNRAQSETLTRAAHTWIRALPCQVRPLELSNLYPRIANAIALRWEYADLLDYLLDDLLIDHRGGRTGFSESIVQELVRLQAFHESRTRPETEALLDPND